MQVFWSKIEGPHKAEILTPACGKIITIRLTPHLWKSLKRKYSHLYTSTLSRCSLQSSLYLLNSVPEPENLTNNRGISWTELK